MLSVLFCFNGCLTCFAVLGLGGVFYMKGEGVVY